MWTLEYSVGAIKGSNGFQNDLVTEVACRTDSFLGTVDVASPPKAMPIVFSKLKGGIPPM